MRQQSGGQLKGSLGRLGLLRPVRRAAAEGALGRLGTLQTVQRVAGGVFWQTGFAASSPSTRCLLLHSTVRHPSESPNVGSTRRIRTARTSRRKQLEWQPGYHFSVYTHRVEETPSHPRLDSLRSGEAFTPCPHVAGRQPRPAPFSRGHVRNLSVTLGSVYMYLCV